MRLLPPTLWLLVAAQIDAQASDRPLPAAVRKMAPDAGAKFYPEYYAFADADLPASSADHAGPAPRSDARPALAARLPLAERDALLLAANASAQLDFRPPFAPHSNSAWDGRALPRAAPVSGLREKRWACPGDTESCADIGYPNSCCGDGEKCVKIDDTGLGPVGCCPSGSTCGGTVSSCGHENTPCESDLGGGCCIPGFVCQGVGCVPSASATPTSTAGYTTGRSSTTSESTAVSTKSSSSSSRATTTTSSSSEGVTSSTNGVSAPVRPTSSGPDSGQYCPTGFYPCVASAGGGCCQTGRDCKTTSCPPAASSTTIVTEHGITIAVPATAVPTSSGGPTAKCAAGWSLCPRDAGAVPGCCPSGYRCGTASCTLATGGKTASTAKELPSASAAAGGRVPLLIAVLATAACLALA